MSKKYRRLSAEDRKVIYNMNKAGFGQTEIGEAIGFGQSTVSKKLSRNRGQKGYRFEQANNLAKERQKLKRARPKVITGEIQEQVEARLLLKHSPDQISKILASQGMMVSPETIYQHILSDRKTEGLYGNSCASTVPAVIGVVIRLGEQKRSRAVLISKSARQKSHNGYTLAIGKQISFKDEPEVVFCCSCTSVRAGSESFSNSPGSRWNGFKKSKMRSTIAREISWP
ncbi:helix-turn-helix domain-containing protein [Akkermansiaceae bacterium]|nr:helix-turn-helix domain-containing protein [Akkermansiaceae bacterium]